MEQECGSAMRMRMGRVGVLTEAIVASSRGWRRAGGPHRGHSGVLTEDGEGLGVLTEAIVGVLTEDGEGLGVLTEAIVGVLTEDGEGLGGPHRGHSWRPHRGWRRAGGPHRDGEGLGVLRSTKFGFSEFKCDPPKP